MIDNWRWAGVPFYLRSGKRLPRKVSEIAVTFKPVPHSVFGRLGVEHLAPNELVLTVQPEEGISLTIEAKQPGAKLCMGSLTLNLDYRSVFGEEPPEAYERLLLDVMLGDQTLFVRSDGVEAAWGSSTRCSRPGRRGSVAGRGAGSVTTRPAPGGRAARTNCSRWTGGRGGPRDAVRRAGSLLEMLFKKLDSRGPRLERRRKVCAVAAVLSAQESVARPRIGGGEEALPQFF